MRQIWITQKGPPEVLQVKEAPDPQAASGEVRIRVKAAGINFADLSARMGLYPDAPKIPCVVGYEVSGVVDQVGSGVSGLAVGDRVVGMPHFGGYSDVVAVPSGQVLPMPPSMSFEEAAAIPVVYLTAHHMLYFVANLREGSRVLVHSAAGGVGLAVIQLAKLRGCTLFGTASPSKHAFLREQGCQHPLDSRGDYAAEVRKLVGERGLDLILDPVGGKSWTEGYQLLDAGGHLVAFGLSAAMPGIRRNLLQAAGQLLRVKRWSPMKLMDDNKSVSGTNMGHLFSRLDILRPQFEQLMKLYQQGAIRPHIARTFPFDQAAAAHQFIHDRKAIGKVLLIP